MLRQGLVCPLDIVPLLVALQGDPEAAIRRAALQYLLIEDEKHPTFLDNRVAGQLTLPTLTLTLTCNIYRRFGASLHAPAEGGRGRASSRTIGDCQCK